jgi:hypothetical protein
VSDLEPEDLDRLEARLGHVGSALRRLEGARPEATDVRVDGAEESLLIPKQILIKWLSGVLCKGCVLGLGAPETDAPRYILGILTVAAP